MKKMRVAQVPAPKQPFQIVERAVPEPGPGEVRVKVAGLRDLPQRHVHRGRPLARASSTRACPATRWRAWSTPLGAGVAGWSAGDRAGLGWHGGHCGYCDACRRGSFVMCMTAARVPGMHYDGGYAEYVVAPAVALARIPEGLSAVEAAPLMCAGVTTFNSLRNAGVRPPDLVAVLGIGGLGHLGVQFASRMGYRTVAIARGRDKEELARKLGAHDYIDSQATTPRPRC